MNDFCTNDGHELNTQQTARCWSSNRAWAPGRAVGDVRAAERGEKTQTFGRLARTLFVRRRCCLFPELFRNRGARLLVRWMQRFVCVLPSNKIWPQLFDEVQVRGFSCASGQTLTHIPQQCGQSHCGVLLRVSMGLHTYPGFVSEFSEKHRVRSVSECHRGCYKCI